MNLVERAAWLKGFAEGLGIDTQSGEGRLWGETIALLGDLARELDRLREADEANADALDDLAEELSYLEELTCGPDDEEDADEEDADEDDGPDGVVYDATCPVCGEEISFDEDTLEAGSVQCPNCGELLEFDLDPNETDGGDEE